MSSGSIRERQPQIRCDDRAAAKLSEPIDFAGYVVLERCIDAVISSGWGGIAGDVELSLVQR